MCSEAGTGVCSEAGTGVCSEAGTGVCSEAGTGVCSVRRSEYMHAQSTYTKNKLRILGVIALSVFDRSKHNCPESKSQ